MPALLRSYTSQVNQYPWATALQLPQADTLILKDKLCALTTLGDINLSFVKGPTYGHGLYSIGDNGRPLITLWVSPSDTVPLLTFAHEFAHYAHDMEWRRKYLFNPTTTKREKAHGPRFKLITGNVLLMCRVLLDVCLPID